MVYTGDGATGVYAYKEGSTDHPEVVFILGANSKYYAKWDVAGYPSSEAYANSEYNLFLVNGTINRMVNGVLTPIASGGSGGGSGLPDGVTITHDTSNGNYAFGNGAKLGLNAVIGSDVSFDKDTQKGVFTFSSPNIIEPVEIAPSFKVSNSGEIRFGTNENERLVVGSRVSINQDGGGLYTEEIAHLVVGSQTISFGTDSGIPALKIKSDTDSITAGMILKIGTRAAEVTDADGYKLYDLSGGGGSDAVVADEGHSLKLTQGTLVYNIDGEDSFGVRRYTYGTDYFNLAIGTNKIGAEIEGNDCLNIEYSSDKKTVSLKYANTASLTVEGNLWFGTNMMEHTLKNLPGIVFDNANKRVVLAVKPDPMGSLWYAVLPVVENLEDASVATVDKGVMTL